MKRKTKALSGQRLIAFLAACMLLVLAGCGSNSTAPSSDAPQGSSTSAPAETSGMIEELRIGITKDIEPRSLASEAGSFGRMNYNAFCAGTWLVRDAENNILPNLMTDWEIGEDGKTIVATFATDQGITWHDGAPFTIEDILFTIDYTNNVMKSGYLSKVTSAERLSDTQVKMNLADSSAYFTLGNSAVFVRTFPKHIWEKIDEPAKYAGDDAMIGCGPYKVAAVDEEARTMTYEAVADSYMGRPLTVKRVVVRSYESQDTLVMALARGEVDAMNDYSNPITPTMLPSIGNVDNLDPGKSINLGLFQILFGFNKQPTDDLAFRKAVRSALNYQLLAATIGGENGQIAGVGVVTPANIGFDASLPTLSQDTAAAMALLDEAGYKDVDGDGFRELPDGSPLNVRITPQFKKTRAALTLRIAEVLIDNLGKVGVRASLDEESARNEDFEAKLRRAGAYEIYINYATQGVAFYKTAYLYVISDPILSMWGTCTLPDFVAAYDRLLTARGYDDYVEAVREMQQINAEQAMSVALCWDTAYYPYRTDKYEGWTNYPGWGVINRQTWYDLRQK